MSIWSHTMFRVYWSFALSEVTYTHTHHTIDRKKISKQTHQLNNIQKNRVEVNSEAKIQPQQTNQPTKSHPCTTAHTHTARVDRFDQASSSLLFPIKEYAKMSEILTDTQGYRKMFSQLILSEISRQKFIIFIWVYTKRSKMNLNSTKNWVQKLKNKCNISSAPRFGM